MTITWIYVNTIRRHIVRNALGLTIFLLFAITYLIPGSFLQVISQDVPLELRQQIQRQQPTLPPRESLHNVTIDTKNWAEKLGDEIRLVSARSSCSQRIIEIFDQESEFYSLDPNKLRDNVIDQISIILRQHDEAVEAIAKNAEKLAANHKYTRDLRVNYTDVHRLRNELLDGPITAEQLEDTVSSIGSSTGGGGGRGTSSTGERTINGGQLVAGPPEWQTPFRSIIMQVNRNFGDLPVNTSMSAVHVPIHIYPGLPDIMNGIAWTAKLDETFRNNLRSYPHVHHQYYGDHLGFLRTFPAHKWRIPRQEPDLFNAKARPWYVAGAAGPKDIVILIDTSGSMTGLRREIAKGVVFEILDTLTTNDYFSVLRFSETVTPVGFPKCNLQQPKLVPQLERQCQLAGANPSAECSYYRNERRLHGVYAREHPEAALPHNTSYMTDDQYKQSIFNVSQDIQDAYFLQATSRNIRYLKSNFSMPTAGIANFTHGLMAAFELLEAHDRSKQNSSQCQQAIMLITDGAIRSHEEIFNRYNYPDKRVRVFTYMIGREVGDITHTKAMACNNRGYYANVINLSELRAQVQKYLPVMSRPLALEMTSQEGAKKMEEKRPRQWTNVYGDETYQVLTDWVLEMKRRERARIKLSEERERLNELTLADSVATTTIELTNITEYDEMHLVDEELNHRLICEDVNVDNPDEIEASLHGEIDPLGHNDLACHWTHTRSADLLTSVVAPVFNKNRSSVFFERHLSKNVWTEHEIHMFNAQLLGVAAVDLRVAELMRLVPSHLLGPNGYPILLGPNGFVMHHPNFRPILEDPFDKQSRILKPYFSSVDLTHVEHQATAERKVMSMRENLVQLRQSSMATIPIRRPIDCRRRPYMSTQNFYFGPMKENPFYLLLALPQNYGLNRLRAKLQLNSDTRKYFNPSEYGLWTLHPDYRYCESVGQQHQPQNQTELLKTLIAVMDLAAAKSPLHDEIAYDDLNLVRKPEKSKKNPSSSSSARYICDRELFPSLLFDAWATYESSEGSCADLPLDECSARAGTNFYSSRQQQEYCASQSKAKAKELGSHFAEIYGLELTFVATRSGLTRTRLFDLSPRIKKLGKLFIERHSRAVDEPWYGRTVNWNMRHHHDTVISAPFNSHVRLVAKLRQRITQLQPAPNDKRSKCDPSLYQDPPPDNTTGDQSTTTRVADSSPSPSIGKRWLPPTEPADSSQADSSQADEPTPSDSDSSTGSPSADATDADSSASSSSNSTSHVDYSQSSTFELLDLIANSSVHVIASQAVIVNKTNGGKLTRTPVAVAGHLYDYASFARRFLNATSLNYHYEPPAAAVEEPAQLKVELCPNNECATRCGLRNDTIDCLLVDNNGFIVVGEELAHIGRSLADYDERLMQSLVDRKVYQQVAITDYQGICARDDQAVESLSYKQQQQQLQAQQQQQTSAGLDRSPKFSSLSSWQLVPALLANLASSVLWTLGTLYSALLFKSAADVDELFAGDGWLGQLYQWQRSAILADAQSSSTYQSLLASLPNKTYLRPCEKTMTLYDFAPHKNPDTFRDHNKVEYFMTRCNCTGWYVFDLVPHTNLLLLVVNMTAPCRRCQPVAAPQPSSVAPVLKPMLDATLNATNSSNKAAEEQVCAMLEHNAQLQMPRSEHCYASHPDEAKILICGSAAQNRPSVHLILALIISLLLLPSAWKWRT